MSESTPLISVIIPLYNKAEHIARTLNSVLAQTFHDFEVIVVDDGSTDDGPEIVAKYDAPRIRLLRQENAGPGAARNAGFKVSMGKYIVFLDADDELAPDFLDASLNNLQNYPGCAASVCAHFRGPDKVKVWTPETSGLRIPKGPWRLPLDIKPEQVKSIVDSFSAGSVLCKKGVVSKFGGYYERHSTYGEDSYLWLQILLNCKIFFDPAPRLWYHTETSKLGISRVEGYPVWPKVLNPYPIYKNCPEEYRDLLDRCLDYYAILAIRRCIRGGDWITSSHILRDFPKTTIFRNEFRVLRRQVKYSRKALFSKFFLKRRADRSQWNIKIAVTPVFSPENPYQSQLRMQLEKQGVTVYDFRATTLLLRRIFRYKVDILHLHWLHPFVFRKTRMKSWLCTFVFLSKLCVARLAGIRIVWTMHNLRDHEEPFSVLSGLVLGFVAKIASQIIVHSETARKEVCESYGTWISKKKLKVIPHGHFIDCYPNHITKTEARKKLGIPDRCFVYLFFGAIREYKGVDKLIAAFNKLENPEAILVIAGKAQDEELNKKISSLCRSRNRIIFNSEFIKAEDVQVYMNACDIVVFPYKKILTSGAVILAMSFGRACIAPKIGCIPDVLDEEGAFLYEGGEYDDQALLTTMQNAFEHVWLIEPFGVHNRKCAEKWRWGEIAETTIKIYRSALKW